MDSGMTVTGELLTSTQTRVVQYRERDIQMAVTSDTITFLRRTL